MFNFFSTNLINHKEFRLSISLFINLTFIGSIAYPYFLHSTAFSLKSTVYPFDISQFLSFYSTFFPPHLVQELLFILFTLTINFHHFLSPFFTLSPKSSVYPFDTFQKILSYYPPFSLHIKSKVFCLSFHPYHSIMIIFFPHFHP